MGECPDGILSLLAGALALPWDPVDLGSNTENAGFPRISEEFAKTYTTNGCRGNYSVPTTRHPVAQSTAIIGRLIPRAASTARRRRSCMLPSTTHVECFRHQYQQLVLALCDRILQLCQKEAAQRALRPASIDGRPSAE